MWQVDYEIVVGLIKRQEWTYFSCPIVTDSMVRERVFSILRIKDDGRAITWKASVKDGAL